jgi:hypothetical protein
MPKSAFSGWQKSDRANRFGHVELALELLDPFWCWVMRRMSAAGRNIVAEERLVRRDRVGLAAL